MIEAFKAKSIIKWKNIPVTREQLVKAKDLHAKSFNAYIEKKSELFKSTTHAGWSEQNRFKMIMNELAPWTPKTMRMCIHEVGVI